MVAEQALAIHVERMGFRYPGNPDASFIDLDLQVPKGTRFGLFGPNGAGKTTLMNLMTGVLAPDKGSIKILGLDTHNKEVNKLFGFVPQDFSFYQELSLSRTWSSLVPGQG
ncbi:ATP-binding cassette domain-containing protein [Mucilaginibacter antarcticus]|uniref:ATP-binding cassette domain-containing protein n=1 Tax=Mucilaginibacter antarcticus TaxID=1855725 RepID=UPI0036385C93